MKSIKALNAVRSYGIISVPMVSQTFLRYHKRSYSVPTAYLYAPQLSQALQTPPKRSKTPPNDPKLSQALHNSTKIFQDFRRLSKTPQNSPKILENSHTCTSPSQIVEERVIFDFSSQISSTPQFAIFKKKVTNKKSPNSSLGAFSYNQRLECEI